MANITIYTKSICPYCTKAKSLLEMLGQTWTEISIEGDQDKMMEMVEKSGRRTVPQIWVGDTHIGGYDDLYAAHQSGELAKLL